MNVGSLYKVKQYFWLLLPTKEIAKTRSLTCRLWINPTSLDWFGRHEITYFSPDSIVVLLEEDGEFKRFLTPDGKIGWTWLDERYNSSFEEVKKES